MDGVIRIKKKKVVDVAEQKDKLIQVFRVRKVDLSAKIITDMLRNLSKLIYIILTH